MKDLTRDSIAVHILTMAAPVGITMLVAVLYQLVNLHFISEIGAEALAGVSIAGTALFAVSAATQVVGVGTGALVAHSAGRKEFATISMVLTQSLVLAALCAACTLLGLYLLMPFYMRELSSADAAVVASGLSFILWGTPGFALLFPLAVVGATLRGIGIVGAPTAIMTAVVVINAGLSFLLIPGQGPIPAMGEAGAGMANTLSTIAGLAAVWLYLHRAERGIVIRRKFLRPDFATWRRLLAIGLPAGAEFALMFFSSAVIYFAIRNEGAAIQAGFGIGYRVLNVILLPALAIATAAGPIAGQSFGAQRSDRVREVFRTTAIISMAVMLIITVLVQWQAFAFVALFDADAAAAGTASLFLRLASWTFVAQALVYTCANMFQGLGNTMPALVSAAARFIIFSAPAVWLSEQPDFQTEHVWYLLAGSVVVQAALSLWLLQVEFKRKLPMPSSAA